jgi:hypothetical protein
MYQRGYNFRCFVTKFYFSSYVLLMESVYIKLFSEVLGEHYHASNNFIEVPLLYEPKKYKRYLSGICHINSFNENVVLSQ